MSSRVLVIDTATAACSVALFEGEKLVANDYQEIGRGHAEKLVPMISEVLDNGRADKIIVNCGPGSFTGVRIGISAAKALALAWKSDLSGYQCLNLIAAQTLYKLNIAKSLFVVMLGGHGEFFVQNFSQDGMPLDELESLDPESALNKAQSKVFAGSGAESLSELSMNNIEIAPSLPDAACAKFLKRDCMTLKISPIYGREPDAIRSRLP